MSRVDFRDRAYPPDAPSQTKSQLREVDGYALRLTPLGIEARKDDAVCVYPFGAVRQWWA